MKPRTLAGLGIFAADAIATAALYSRLPVQIPLHWGIHGADRFGARWTIFLLGPLVIAILFALFLWLERIDPFASRPLPADAPPAERGSFGAMVIALIGLTALEHIALMLYLAKLINFGPHLGHLALPVILMVMGNYLPRVRPNYFAGIRTPWTLSSETVWRRTNRLAGKLLFYGGLACAVLAFAPNQVFVIALVVIALAAVAAPVIASYVWWRQERAALP